ncbi:MAG TPA: YihY/virulence factor BrkB family protein [Streptosporangiaceae bacterium]|jgi:YihY family inner membrane protein|nr:YihY/virulence factor BrkB family protein [Streptosporangiaceae bacterium]
MSMAKKAIRAADELQQRHAWLAVPVAVWKKFGDDSAGNLAALIAYYAFAALFPLLLVLVTVLDIVLKNDPALQKKLLNSALAQYPVIGPQLGHIGRLHQAGLALVIGLLGTFIGSRGVATAMQNALNSVWEIPIARRPSFPWSWLRSFGLILVIGLGLIGTTIVSGLASGAGHVLTGLGASVAAIAVSLVLNIGVFWLAFRLGTASEIGWRQLRLGAVIGAVIWQVLQSFGGYFVSHQLAHASPSYGTFAVVIGLLAWLYLEAELTLYAVEINVVRTYRLWPRSIAPPPYTKQDRRAYQLYAEAQKRRKDMDIVVGVGGEDDREKTAG